MRFRPADRVEFAELEVAAQQRRHGTRGAQPRGLVAHHRRGTMEQAKHAADTEGREPVEIGVARIESQGHDELREAFARRQPY
ncbi:MAG: hypothetical protein IPK20_22035 [Betaproteobacteria bacterium]|nr:hypothetical protein [Betaproteobacteria bacterium]